MLLLFLHTLIYFYFWCILWSIFELHLKYWISFFLEFFLLSWLLISCIRCLRFFCFSDSSPINESIWGFAFVYIQTEYVTASSMDSTMVFQPDCALVGFSTSLMFLNTFSLYSFLSISFLRLLSRYFCIQQFEETIHDHCFNVAWCLHATIWSVIEPSSFEPIFASTSFSVSFFLLLLSVNNDGILFIGKINIQTTIPHRIKQNIQHLICLPSLRTISRTIIFTQVPSHSFFFSKKY